jgi:glycosyltransferase involved in cell wall biosynthesis
MPTNDTLGNRNMRYQNCNWNAASKVDRAFVKFSNQKNSPGEYLLCSPDNCNPKLSVIIPTSDAYRDGYFPKLIEQIRKQSYSNFELIVVRGDFKQGRAINVGASIAQGKYILTLDDDTALHDSNTFSKLVKRIEKNTNIGIAGGVNIIPEDATPFIKRTMNELPRRLTPPVNKVLDSDLAEHPLLIMRKDVFLQIGGENELIPRGLDPYLRQEFRKAGFRVVIIPDVYYSHLPPSTLPKLIKQFFKNGKQAAFCNRFYPQWVIETPDHHGQFVPKIPFSDRIIRYFKELLKAILDRKWILLSSKTAYAVGFILSVIFSAKKSNKQIL